MKNRLLNPVLNPVLILLIAGIPCITTAKDKEFETPSLEFLEFLGEWTNSENQWIDPLSMKQIEEKDRDASTKEGDKHE